VFNGVILVADQGKVIVRRALGYAGEVFSSATCILSPHCSSPISKVPARLLKGAKLKRSSLEGGPPRRGTA